MIFHLLDLDEFRCVSVVLFFALSNHELHSKLHSSFMLFILNFHSISWIYYNLFSTILWQYTKKEKRRNETRERMETRKKNETQIYINSPLLSPYISSTQYFYCIIIHILCRSIYILYFLVSVCVFHYFGSVTIFFLLLLPLGKCFSIHAFWRFSLSHSHSFSGAFLFFSSLLPLFVHSRKIMHK